MTRKEAGLTLLEILIALLILGVASVMAHAFYQSAMAKARIAESQVQLQSAITASMRRAVISGHRVVMCPSLDAENCAEGSDWSHGWISFADMDKNRLRGPEEPLLISHLQPAQKVRILSNSGRPRLVFHANGTNPGTNATFTLCDGRSRSVGAELILSSRMMAKSRPTPCCVAWPKRVAP